MKRSVALLTTLAGVSGCAGSGPEPDAGRDESDPPDAATAGGWVSLLQEDRAEAWRGFGREDLPEAWTVADSVLRFAPGGDGGDIVTRERYRDFELTLEWQVEEGGNSGIFFHVTEDADHTYETGPEMQVLDNARHPDGRDPLTSAGANYALHSPEADVTRPVGEWNEVRIRVEGPRVQHWLNGRKVVEYELWTEDWHARVRDSKFNEWSGYGLAREGHIALQDHGDPVRYRRIRIRRL